MNFYTSIAELYDQIFPLSKEQVAFTEEAITDIARAQLLDIGCGTGNLTLALGKTCKTIVGIDLDAEMLNVAKQKLDVSNVCFDQGNMLTLGEQFAAGSFVGIVCYGNTMVHLRNMEEIEIFIGQCHKVLKPKGKLLIQIINYDRILDDNIDSLPSIENDFIKFERNYEYLKEEHKINFKTVLSHKLTNQVIKNEQLLFPIRENELVNVLKLGGFKNIHSYGNFKKSVLSPDSIPLIIEAQKV